MSPRSAIAIWVLALAVAGGIAAIVVTSDNNDEPVTFAFYHVLVGLAFVGAGLVAALRRDLDRIALLMALTGFTWFLGALTAAEHPVPFTFGLVLNALPYAFLVWLVLAYPTGRLRLPVHRLIVGMAFALAVVGSSVYLLFEPSQTEALCDDCPENLLLVVESEAAADAARTTFDAVGIAIAIAVIAILARRWRRASAARRRLFAPVYVMAGIAAATLGASMLTDLVTDEVYEPFAWVITIAFVGVPGGFLVGLLRAQPARAAAGRLLLEVPDEPTPHEAQAALRRVLGDPTLELWVWQPEQSSFVDADGKPRELPDQPRRGVTPIGYGGRPLAALVHDPALLHEPELLAEVAATARVALEKDRSLRTLRASERRSRALLRALPDVMYRVRRDGTYVDFHANDPRDLAAPPDQIVGNNVCRVLPEELAAQVMEGIERALATGELQSLEYRLRRPFRGEREAETRIVRSGEDEVVVIVRDVSERKAIERRNEALLEAIPDSMYRFRRDGTLLDMHASDPDDLPLPPEEMVGRNIVELVPGDGPMLLAALAQALDEGTMQTREYQSVRRKSGRRDLEGRAVPSGDDEVVVIVRDITDRKRHDEALQRAVAFQRRAINATPSPFAVLDSEGGTIFFNTALERLSGYQNDETVTPNPFWELFIAPEGHEEARRALEEVNATGEIVRRESEWLTLAGERRTVSWSLSPLVNEEGVPRVLLTGLDITERKRQEQALERERDFVRDVVRVASSIFAVVGTNGEIDRFNHECERVTGLADDEHVRGRPFWEAFLPADEETLARDALEEVKLTGITTQRECDWLHSRTGEHRTVTWALTPIVDAEGRPRYLLTGLDVTERKLAERRSRALLEAIPDVMYRIRRDGTYLDFHAGDPRDLVAPPGEIIGRRVQDLAPPHLVDLVMSGIERTLETGDVQTLEYEIERRGKGLRSVEARVLRSGADEVVGIVRDVTDRKRQEEEIRASRARIVEAGDQARRKLERNLHDGAQQRLVSLSIALRLAVAKLRDEPDAAESLLSSAVEELTHALEELRELARGIHPAILSDRGLVPALKGLASRSPVPVDLELPEDRLPEQVEAAAYYVVSESLANIAKYAHATQVSVRVTWEDGNAVVEVADDGIGGADTTRGTGILGLADRVESLGGRLGVESPLGQGTRVLATIPVPRSAAAK